MDKLKISSLTFVKKNRAKGDEVPIEFGVEFVPIFNKYIEFRTWLLSKYSKEYLSIYGDHLFIYLPTSRSKLTKTTKHAKRHFWLNDVCTCHGLLPSHSA